MLAFFARACPERVEGAGGDAAHATFVRSAQTPLRTRSWYRSSQRTRRNGAPRPDQLGHLL